MNKHLLSSLLLGCFILFTAAAIAQAPQSFNYQGIARNNVGTVLPNRTISIQVSILEDSAKGPAVYTETQSTITTAQGYFTILIGGGTPTLNTFSQINWGDNTTKWLQISMDPSGGTNYALVGSSQLVSVPFALYSAKTASTPLKAKAPLAITNNLVKINAGTTVGDLISWDGINWVAKQPAHLPDTSIAINNMQPYLVLNWCIAMQGIFPSRNGQNPFLGEIELFGFNFNPVGWAFCNGALLPISQNTALFSLLGTYYGGDGVSTFALPDLRGRVPLDFGQGPGLSNYNQGQVGGNQSNTITIHR